ncbi:MAG: hypothetical protein JNM84_24500 [Planctomycetes bacterium]|nr:hypothetical protein [Planctomycetota bacterium]
MNPGDAEEPLDERRLVLLDLLTGQRATTDPRAAELLGDPAFRKRYEALRQLGGQLDRLAAEEALARDEAEQALEDRLEAEARTRLFALSRRGGSRRLLLFALAAALLLIVGGVAYWFTRSEERGTPDPRGEYYLAPHPAKLRVAPDFALVTWDALPAGTVVQVRVHTQDGATELERSRALGGNEWNPEKRSEYPEVVRISLWRVGPNGGRIGEALLFGRDGELRSR